MYLEFGELIVALCDTIVPNGCIGHGKGKVARGGTKGSAIHLPQKGNQCTSNFAFKKNIPSHHHPMEDDADLAAWTWTWPYRDLMVSHEIIHISFGVRDGDMANQGAQPTIQQ